MGAPRVWTPREQAAIALAVCAASFLLSGVTVGTLAFRRLVVSRERAPLFASRAEALSAARAEAAVHGRVANAAYADVPVSAAAEAALAALFVRALLAVRLAGVPMGCAVDFAGPRVVAMAGTLFAGAGYALMAAAPVSLRDLEGGCPPLLTAGYVLAAVGGYCVHAASLCLPRILFCGAASGAPETGSIVCRRASVASAASASGPDGCASSDDDEPQERADPARDAARRRDVAVRRMMAAFTLAHTASPVGFVVFQLAARHAPAWLVAPENALGRMRLPFLAQAGVALLCFALVTSFFPPVSCADAQPTGGGLDCLSSADSGAGKEGAPLRAGVFWRAAAALALLGFVFDAYLATLTAPGADGRPPDEQLLEDLTTLLPVCALVGAPAVAHLTSAHSLAANAALAAAAAACLSAAASCAAPGVRPLAMLAACLLRPHYVTFANQVGSRLVRPREMGRAYGAFLALSGGLLLPAVPVLGRAVPRDCAAHAVARGLVLVYRLAMPVAMASLCRHLRACGY